MLERQAVSDSGPLIWLARCGRLNLLNDLYGKIVIPQAVYIETVDEGARRGYADAQVIRAAVDEEWIQVRAPARRMIARVRRVEDKLGIQLGQGEMEAISLSRELGCPFLSNDELAYRAAKEMNVSTRGVIFLLLISVRKELLDKYEAEKALETMLNEGLWLAPVIIQRFYQALGKPRADV